MSGLSVDRFIEGVGSHYRGVFSAYVAEKEGITPRNGYNVLAQELVANGAPYRDVMAAFVKAYGMTTSDIAQSTESTVHQLVNQFPPPKHHKLTKFIEAPETFEMPIF
jgi:hypothetical protein